MKTDPKHLLFTEDRALNAQTHVHCPDCGAPVGQPCKNAVDGTHTRRVDAYTHWLVTYNNYYRTTPIRPRVPAAA